MMLLGLVWELEAEPNEPVWAGKARLMRLMRRCWSPQDGCAARVQHEFLASRGWSPLHHLATCCFQQTIQSTGLLQ